MEGTKLYLVEVRGKPVALTTGKGTDVALGTRWLLLIGKGCIFLFSPFWTEAKVTDFRKGDRIQEFTCHPRNSENYVPYSTHYTQCQ